MNTDPMNNGTTSVDHLSTKQHSHVDSQQGQNSTQYNINNSAEGVKMINELKKYPMTPRRLEYSYWSRHRTSTVVCAFALLSGIAMTVGVMTMSFTSPNVTSPTFNTQLDAPWTLFKRIFEKQYASVEDEINRRLIWESNINNIRKHNLEADLGLHTYTLGMNKYSDLTNAEFNKQMNTLNLNLRNQTRGLNSHTFNAPANFRLPDWIDWTRQGYVTEVKDQGQCGSCWAFSTTGSLEGQHFAKTGQLVSLSEQNLIDCSVKYGNNGCDGGNMDRAFQYIKDNGGINEESSYPYEAQNADCRFDSSNVVATVTDFVDIASQDENALQAAVATVGPISVAIDSSYSSFRDYKGGVYNEPACSTTELNHAVLVVGYASKDGQDCYIVKNSWGSSWGDGGYILMSRNKNNQCGIATMASYPLV